MLCALLALAGRAEAHHGALTTKVGSAPSSSLPSAEWGAPLPRLAAGMGLDFERYGRVRRGSQNRELSPLGQVSRAMATLQLSLKLRSLTQLSLEIPSGVVQVEPEEGDARSSWGMGDLRVQLSQELNQFFGWKRDRRSFVLLAGASAQAPTGRYEPQTELSAAEVTAGNSGSFAVTNYYSQASLGMGSWSGAGWLQSSWPVSARVHLLALGSASTPLSETQDEIRWGNDFAAALGARISSATNAWSLATHAEHRWHTRDSIRGALGAEVDLREATAFGGWSQWSMRWVGQVSVAARATCSAGVHLPLWQRARFVQLMESVTVSSRCSWAVGP